MSEANGQQARPKYGFSKSDFDWDIYARARPDYRDSLFNRILDYHNAHGGGYEEAHDVGAGYGVVSKQFLTKHFKHVWTSDPVPHNLEAAKHLLKDEIEAGKVTPVHAAAENHWLPEGSIDLVTAFECFHWCESDKAIQAVAAQLKPGGTFAACFYSQVFVRHNTAADEAWADVFHSACGKWLGKWPDALKRGYNGLQSCCPLPLDLFEPGARRIRMNVELLEKNPHREKGVPFKLSPNHPPAEQLCVVGETDVCEDIEDAELWDKEVDTQWFRDYLLSFQEIPLDTLQKGLSQVDAALEGSGGKAKVCWVADLVLATRKKS